MDRRHHRSAHGYPRTARLNALLVEVLAEEVRRHEEADERLSLLTVTGVECSSDLRHAEVLFASIGEEAAAALEEHRKALQAAIGSQLRLRRTPTLAFSADPAVAAGARVEEALRRAARRSDGTGGVDDAPGA